MSGVKLKLSGADLTKTKRKKDDFYATTDEAIKALCQFRMQPKRVWEPCCGDGAIAAYLSRMGSDVAATDLVDRGYGVPRVDFLMEWKKPANAIITNPPFNLAHDFIRHSVSLGIGYMALLLKADFWCTLQGSDVFKNVWRPKYCLPLSWRPDFTGQGRPHLTCQWVIWDGLVDTTETFILDRPK